ncbi:DUF1853 family protein [Marinomonas mediterranea]|jgi:Uncharacterized protein conserved in bacteria|uniref:DUF1853 domain-containing protein n=1 Tax=Marinomonas mediterranea (strain ATCC 700492 / JCM 21426 / NBRC 103028 / MMB-1) TaxID=717774 RepID=F2JVU1_MARM1|nr:DUF1853 family protein [Marinomonas mediterranea]ADZ91727.1 Domain of unknown function DUF1853 [Marinomonas mediterranea MMB-1]WCN09687.1 DUF1853 family protein [Marinomonas mediterranea]WCN13768.1 DUF1853 family protein [Marinomonas mediterranea]WCN17823.1 DUF1853 family protein [Marinomonas mediterranea MMB-1]
MVNKNLIDDLRWVLQFETINDAMNLVDYRIQDWDAQLENLSNNRTLIEDAFSEVKSHFLGTYFEVLFSFAIRHFTTLEVICEHEQIHLSGRTLGEVDLIVRTPQGEFIQFEIAIKFYLQRPDLVPHDWIGPNKNDSLYKKTERALTHQLTILKTDEGIEWLKSRSLPVVERTELLVFGRLFYDFLNRHRHHSDAVWIRFDDFCRAAFSSLAIAKKPHWLTHAEDMEYIDHSECCLYLKECFTTDSRPVLFAVYDEFMINDGNKWVFVVPNAW